MIAQYWRHTFCIVLCLLGAHMSMAQSTPAATTGTSVESTPDYAQPGDPSRWYKDDATAHDYAVTLKKDADAAYQEAKISCHSLDLSARPLCVKEAQSQHKQDLMRAQRKEQSSRQANNQSAQ